MQEGSRVGGPEPTETEQLKAEIEQTREELGETVEALAEKADVKSQAKAKVDERKAALEEKRQELKGKVSTMPQRARELKPEDARRLASQATTKAKERPGPAIAVGLVAGLVVLRLTRRS